jgi:hypothetical protein
MWEAIDPTPEDCNARLRELDLVAEDLLHAVRVGTAARRTATRHHPRAFGGWLEYGERTAGLRDGLSRKAWTPEELDGVCLTVHPQRRLAIMSALGTPGTGTREPVTTRRKRGETTERIVRVNAQLELDLHIVERKPVMRTGAMPTYVLLVYTDAESGEVRSELSLAKEIGDGFIDEWLDRIALPVVRLNDALDFGHDDSQDPPDFDLPER